MGQLGDRCCIELDTSHFCGMGVLLRREYTREIKTNRQGGSCTDMGLLGFQTDTGRVYGGPRILYLLYIGCAGHFRAPKNLTIFLHIFRPDIRASGIFLASLGGLGDMHIVEYSPYPIYG